MKHSDTKQWLLVGMLVVVACALQAVTPVLAQDEAIDVESNVMVSMRDETQLAANIFRPRDDGPHPTILLRTPYGKGSTSHGQGRIAYYGGAFQLALMMHWGAAVGGARLGPDDADEAFRFLPLNRFDDQLDQEVFYLEDWVQHPVYDDYWKQRGIGREAFDDITVPILNIGGWYDIFSKPTLEMINGVRSESEDRAVRRNQFAIIGPWAHGVYHGADRASHILLPIIPSGS